MRRLTSLFTKSSSSEISFHHLETDELVHLPNQCVYPQAKDSNPNLVSGGIQELGHKDFVYQWRGKGNKGNPVTLTNVSKLTSDVSKQRANNSKSGHYYYGGPIFNHLGHFLAESIHRLMQYKELNSQLSIEKVVFIPQRFKVLNGLRKPSLPPQFYEILDYLGIPKEHILLLRKPIVFENLWIAKQQSYFRTNVPISQAYLSFLKSRENSKLPSVSAAIPTKVYVSRSNYFLRGSFAGEKYIENVLEQNGFTIYYPENHNLVDQLKVYCEAKELIFSEGSAIHILELLSHVKAKVGVIRRRKNGRLAIEAPLANRAHNYSMFEHTFPLPSLFVAPKKTRAATGSAICFLNLKKLSEYLSTEFGIENVSLEELKHQTLKDLAFYRQSYAPKLTKNPSLSHVLADYDEDYEALIKYL